METNNINNDISSLPPEVQRQVFDFISFLKNRYQKPRKARASRKGKLSDSPFIGIWEDRKDMNDSSSWVRNLRTSEWGGLS
ncbi:MAG: DUF2281 domain-containing protein [Thermodesulfobacteriota bacterium]